MKKKWIAAGTAAGVILLGAGIVFAVKQSNQERVKVVSMQEMMGWSGGMNDMSMSGNITSDVSQDVYLGQSQEVDEIFVQEGDTVMLGDPLVSYDMTLVNLELEMKKLDKEGIQLNIKKAEREIKKLKNTKPASDDFSMDDPGFLDDPGADLPEEPQEPGEEPAAAYEELDGESEPYMGEGTVEDPYHFLCGQEGVILGSFLNKMAKEQCFFLIEVREGDLSNGELLKVWGETIKDEKLNLPEDARYQMKLDEVEDDTIRDPKPQADEMLDQNDVEEYYRGDGSAEKPYTYVVKGDGVVKGSFFQAMKEKKVYFRLEVWKEDTYGTTLLKAWEQNAENIGELDAEDEYLVNVVKKEKEEENPEDSKEGNDPTPPPEEKSTPSVSPELTTPTPEVSTTPSPEPTENPEPTQPTDPELSVPGSPDPKPDTPSTQDYSPQSETQDGSINGMTASGYNNTVVPMTFQKTVNNVMGDSSMGGGASKEELQKQIKEKEQEIKGYQLDLKEADLEIKKIEKNLKNQTIRSTLTGVVKSVGDPEQISGSGKPLIQVVSSEGLYIKGSISEMNLVNLQVGDKLNGYSYDTGVSFIAEVREISPYPLEGEQGNNASMYPFTAYIENAEGLKNYSYAELTPMGENESGGSNKVTVEKPFVRTQDGEYYVMIDDGNGRLKKQVVHISRIIWGSTYEIADGLTWNDKIAFPYGKNVKEGAKTEDGTLQDLYR